MNLGSRILLGSAGLVSMSLSLSACAGTPAPCTEPTIALEQQETISENTVPQKVSEPNVSQEQKLDSQQESKKIAEQVPQPLSSSSSVVQVQNAESSSSAQSVVIDPYTAFPAMVSEVFEYADSLYKQGKVDEAVAYLQRFRVIKPLWNQWENQADSMLLEFGKTNAERAKQYEPMVLEILNMNRARSAYSLVAQVADSLVALAPGDSLENFARQQKMVAFNNTLDKAGKEKIEIMKLATDQAKFAEAEQKAVEFQMRYRDFEDALKIQAMIDEIRNMAASNDSEAAAYWQKNDPAEALAKAKGFVEKAKFAEAKELLTKLKASVLRKEAVEEYNKLADAFCNAQRKNTSLLFGKAQKQKDSVKKASLLKEAIASLDKCLSEYPENSQKQKVLDNKKFLQKELGE